MKRFGFLTILVGIGLASSIGRAETVCADLFSAKPVTTWAIADVRIHGYVERLIEENQKLGERALPGMEARLHEMVALGFGRLQDFDAVLRQTRTIERILTNQQKASIAETIKLIETSRLRYKIDPPYFEALIQSLQKKIKNLQSSYSLPQEERSTGVFHLRYAIERLTPAAKHIGIQTRDDFERELIQLPQEMSWGLRLTNEVVKTIVAFSEKGRASREDLRRYTDTDPFFASMAPFTRNKVVFLSLDHPLTSQQARHILLRLKAQDDPEMWRVYTRYEDLLKAKDLFDLHRRQPILNRLSGIR